MKKGQTSIEFIILFSVAILIFIFIYVTASNYVFVEKETSLRKQTDNYFNNLINAANDVYYKGVGSRRKVFVVIPKGIDANKSGIQNNFIFLNINGSDVFYAADVNLKGTLPLTPGGHFVYLTAYPGYVKIGYSDLIADKYSIYKVMSQDSNDFVLFRITNISDRNILVDLNLLWDYNEINLDLNNASFLLSSEQSEIIKLSISTSESAIGIHSGKIHVFADNNLEFDITVTVDVSANVVDNNESNLLVFPSVWELSLYPGDSNWKTFQICNNSESDFNDVIFYTDNSDLNTFLGNVDSVSVAADSCIDKNILLSVPNYYSPGTYVGTIVVKQDNENYDVINVIVYVLADMYFIDEWDYDFNKGIFYGTDVNYTYLLLKEGSKELPNNQGSNPLVDMTNNLLLYHANSLPITDSSGNGYNATYDDVSLVDGYSYNAYEFDSESSAFVNFPNVDALTVSFWANFYLDGKIHAVIGKKYSWQIIIKNNKLYYVKNYGDNDYFNHGVAIPTGWHYYTIVDDGSQIKIYIDGELKDLELFNASFNSNDYNLVIGKNDFIIGEALYLNRLDKYWRTYYFKRNYFDPNVVCTYLMPTSWWYTYPPAVVRLNNVTNSNFNIFAQNPGDLRNVQASSGYCIVLESGLWDLGDGAKAYANKEKIDRFNNYTDWSRYFVETLPIRFKEPAVLGNIISYNNKEWSTFWSSSATSSKNVPYNTNKINVGLHIGEDTYTYRDPEEISYIVLESGLFKNNFIKYQIGVTNDFVRSVVNNPPYRYYLDDDFKYAVVTQTAMDGYNGSWAYLYGSYPVSNYIDLAVDEDQIYDSERNHTTEQISFITFTDDSFLTAKLESFVGKIDEIAIFDRALTESEIKNIYIYYTSKYDFDGNFESRIFDANATVDFTHIYFKQGYFGKELPNDNTIEDFNLDLAVNMAQNSVLYHMNDLSGTDYSGNSNNADVYNLTLDEGIFKKSNYFSDSYYMKENVNNFPKEEITIEMWLKTNDSSNFGTILSYNEGEIYGNDLWIVDPRNLRVYRGTYNYVLTYLSLNDNKWHHLVIEWSALTSDLKIYVDSVLRYDGSLTGDYFNGNGCLVIGKDQDNWCGGFEASQNYVGYLDEYAIYNKLLTEDEIKSHYLRGITKIKHQIKSCNLPDCSDSTYVGPDGSSNSFYFDDLNVDLNLNGRYFRYKTYINTLDLNYSPRLDTVIIDYR